MSDRVFALAARTAGVFPFEPIVLAENLGPPQVRTNVRIPV
jgi:hypothetical protein